MSTIPDGYRLLVVAPDSSVIESIDLDGYDLTQPLAQADVALDVVAAINRNEA